MAIAVQSKRAPLRVNQSLPSSSQDHGLRSWVSAFVAIIPIDAKSAVANPAVFAISREHPGGLVVSDASLLVVASM